MTGQTMVDAVVSLLRSEEPTLVDFLVADAYHPESAFPSYRAKIPVDDFRAMGIRVFRTIGACLEADSVEPLDAMSTFIGKNRVAVGVSITEIIGNLALVFDSITAAVDRVHSGDAALRVAWRDKRFSLMKVASSALAEAYIRARDDRIREQRAEIERLAAPIAPVQKGILLVPIVGTLDAARADQVTLSLLEAITVNSAEVVLLDITGVANVDAEVADHLLGAARAAKLVGAEVILVGVNPKIAQTIVELGLDLGDLRTLGDLENGIEYALALQGKEIRPRKARARAR